MDTPINIFKKAVELSKTDSFTVETNNPQLVEALEVLCGEKNIVFIIRSGGENYQQDTAMAVYEYLGDVYDIINSLRFQQELDMQITDKCIEDEINEYEAKHQFACEKLNHVIESNFKKYEEILPPPKQIEAYRTDKIAVFHDFFGNKRIAKRGDWITRDGDGNLNCRSNLGNYKEIGDK